MKPKLVMQNQSSEQELNLVERQTYTIEQAAKILGVCRAVAYRRGVLPTIRVAGRRLVPKRALEQMLTDSVIQSGHAAMSAPDVATRKQKIERAKGQ